VSAPLRNPLTIALVALLVVGAAVTGFVLLDNWENRAGRGERSVREIRAQSAPLITADVARFEESRRRAGDGYAAGETLLADWLGQYPRSERERMLGWTRDHALRTDTRSGGFSVRTSSGPDVSGWFRIEVDRAAGLVRSTCGGDPAPGCAAGRWRPEDYGLEVKYLMGR